MTTVTTASLTPAHAADTATLPTPTAAISAPPPPHQQPHPPGTLLHRFPISNNNQRSLGKAEAKYILHWLCILGDGPTKFERAIARNRRHPSDPIALFTIVCQQSMVVKAAHGFNTIIVQDKDHAANGRIGFFLGDRIAAANEHGWHLQNPPLCTAHD